MKTSYEGDMTIVKQAVTGAADLAFSGPYIGVSYKDLARYKRWENPTEELTLDEDDEEITHLYAALSVLVRAAMSAPTKTTGSQWVNVAGMAVRETERRFYPLTAFPYDAEGFPQADARDALPTAEQLAAVSMPERFQKLETDGIRHEWTVKAGKRLFLELTARIDASVRSAICSEKGVFGLRNQNDLLDVGMVVTLLIVGKYGFDQDVLTVAATVAVIMARRGVQRFCERQQA